MSDTLSDFRGVLAEAGLAPGEVVADGKLHRCPTTDKTQARDGWYVLHTDPPASGAFGNWRTGLSDTWTATEERILTPQEREHLRQRVEADRKAREKAEQERHAEAAAMARSILAEAPDCPAHEYLTRKKVAPCAGLMVARDGRLVVPVLGADGKAQSVQFIDQGGGKRFLTGGKVAGGFFAVKGKSGPLFLVEGLATGLTVAETTGRTVLCAFNAGNLLAVARMARKKYPERPIIVAADNDTGTDGNPGLTAGTAAALDVGGKLALPVFPEGAAGTDFNDLAAVGGMEEVKRQLAEAREPEPAKLEPSPPCRPAPAVPVPFDCYMSQAIPEAAVPGVLRDFSLALAESIQVPFELALCNVLGAVAAVAQRKFRVVEIRPGYSEGLNIYALCPLPPGERKSAVVEACKRPLVDWQAAMRREMEGVIRDARSERLTLEKTIEAKRSKAAKTGNSEARRAAIEEIKAMERELPEVPEAPRLLADDFTPEALAVLMSRHDQRIALLEAEGGLFDTLAGRYSRGVPNLDLVLKSWSGESSQVDRKGQDTIYLDAPHLTLVISPQPDVVQGLAENPGFRGRGLVGRFLYFMPQSRLGCRAVESSPVPPGVVAAYHEMIHRLLSLPWAQDEHGQKTAYCIRLDPGAYALWRAFAEAMEVELRPGREFEHMTDWAGKFPGQAVRLAGLFHIATVPEPQRTAIGADTMRSALDVAVVLAEHAKAAYGLMGSDPAQECAKAILGWMLRERREAFTARDALRAVRGKYPTMEKVRPGLALLEERAYILPADGQESRGPGRKSSTPYVVNPLTWEAPK